MDYSGYRAWFRHSDGEEYSMLIKGTPPDLKAAASICVAEERAHDVVCFRLDLWNREDD